MALTATLGATDSLMSPLRTRVRREAEGKPAGPNKARRCGIEAVGTCATHTDSPLFFFSFLSPPIIETTT